MTHLLEQIRAKGRWLLQRPPDYLPPRRIVTLGMVLAVVGAPVATVGSWYLDSRADLRSAQCDRVEAREGSRARAFTNIDYVAAVLELIDRHVSIPGDLLADLAVIEAQERRLVDEQLPPIVYPHCPPPNTTIILEDS